MNQQPPRPIEAPKANAQTSPANAQKVSANSNKEATKDEQIIKDKPNGNTSPSGNTPDNNENTDDKKSLSKSTKIAIIVVCVVLILGIIIGTICIVASHNKKEEQETTTEVTTVETTVEKEQTELTTKKEETTTKKKTESTTKKKASTNNGNKTNNNHSNSGASPLNITSINEIKLSLKENDYHIHVNVTDKYRKDFFWDATIKFTDEKDKLIYEKVMPFNAKNGNMEFIISQNEMPFCDTGYGYVTVSFINNDGHTSWKRQPISGLKSAPIVDTNDQRSYGTNITNISLKYDKTSCKICPNGRFFDVRCTISFTVSVEEVDLSSQSINEDMILRIRDCTGNNYTGHDNDTYSFSYSLDKNNKTCKVTIDDVYLSCGQFYDLYFEYK